MNPQTVSNTTPIICLAGVGLLDLLGHRYSNVWIAEQVFKEYQEGATASDPNLRTLPWLTISPVTAIPLFSRKLDGGEAATIALALSTRASIILLDDKKARREAIKLGLHVAGTMDVLLWSKRQGLIPFVAPVIDAMQRQGRRISPALRALVLMTAGE